MLGGRNLRLGCIWALSCLLTTAVIPVSSEGKPKWGLRRQMCQLGEERKEVKGAGKADAEKTTGIKRD